MALLRGRELETHNGPVQCRAKRRRSLCRDAFRLSAKDERTNSPNAEWGRNVHVHFLVESHRHGSIGFASKARTRRQRLGHGDARHVTETRLRFAHRSCEGVENRAEERMFALKERTEKVKLRGREREEKFTRCCGSSSRQNRLNVSSSSRSPEIARRISGPKSCSCRRPACNATEFLLAPEKPNCTCLAACSFRFLNRRK